MPRRPGLTLPILALFLAAAAPAPPAAPLLGFSDERAAQQRDLEARFDSHLKAENLREWMKRLSARPHHVGSAYGKENAEFMAGLFRSWGYDTKLEEFHVLFPTPAERVLEMVAPTHFTASLAETAVPGDSTSGQTDEQLPTYNAYSIDGDVTGELVYVNFGVPADYEELERRGVDVKGKIVIARYYGSWRGIKPKVAAEHGAIGCIIYSDPREDGYGQGDPYPKGGWRPEQGVQRGSVVDMPTYTGDPLTPFIGATKDAKRLKREEVTTLTKIPVLPISYADALPLLRALGGPLAPGNWQGGLPTPYHLGPGPAKVHLKLKFDWNIVPAYDVIARMEGSEHPDQWIVRGNHHDAWVNGATDPISGMVAVMEEARAIGELAKTGWRPKRTLVFAGWDAEEQGLLGSTEWAETHAAELRDKAVAYINSDSNSRGFLGIGGSHTLEVLSNQVARDVTDPQKGVTVAERLRSGRIFFGDPEDRKAALAGQPFHLDALGSGSDFTPFLQHLNIASINLGYGGEEEYGQYHSIYDSFDHYVRFMDPDFSYGVALAKTGGRLVLRLSEADVLPMEFTRLADAVGTYADQVVKLADQMRTETEERAKLLDEKIYETFDDPTKTLVAPKRHDPVPHLNFAPLLNAVGTLRKSAQAYDSAWSKGGGPILPAATRDKLDAILMKTERALGTKEGLPGRPWYRHQIYAPGFYTGYGVKTLPAVREAIEQRQWKDVAGNIEVLARTIEGVAKEIDRATALLGGK
ncbi:MAG TPA: transferrin receptor-like dimerization domain-containing protein [Thermoanaerobaculia bacterium]|nr:transferrin receptor-like dimerization domain-containing protein [Thermoanaerobaculia bacterium]